MEEWQVKLEKIIKKRERRDQDSALNKSKIAERHQEVDEFFKSIVLSTFFEVKEELEKHKRQVEIVEPEYTQNMKSSSIIVSFQGKKDFKYNITVDITVEKAVVTSEHHCMITGRLRAGWLHAGEDWGGTRISTVTKENIIIDFLNGYDYCMIY
ncbi:MAG: hypothetical protein WBB67_06470 [bacterium]